MAPAEVKIMILNLGEKCRFYCGEHRNPVAFSNKYDVNKGNFICPKTFLEDTAHPHGHKMIEPACQMRLPLTVAGDIIEKLSRILSEQMAQGNFFNDLTGLCFRVKGYECCIFYYSDNTLIKVMVKRRACA